MAWQSLRRWIEHLRHPVDSGGVHPTIAIADIAVALTLSLASLFAADYTGMAATAVLAPALLGELGLTAWLLVKGVNVRRGAPLKRTCSAGPLSADVHVGAATEGTR